MCDQTGQFLLSDYIEMRSSLVFQALFMALDQDRFILAEIFSSEIELENYPSLLGHNNFNKNPR